MNHERVNKPEPPDPRLPESANAVNDPLLVALAAAEWDDEPYTNEQQALAEAGGEEICQGESMMLEDVKMRFDSHPESRLRASG